MRGGIVILGVVAGVLGADLAASALSTQRRVQRSFYEIGIPEPEVQLPGDVTAEIRWKEGDGLELSGVVWAWVQRHPLSNSRARPRRGPSVPMPILLAANEDRLDMIEIALPSWARGPMLLVPGYRRRTRLHHAAPFYVEDPAFVPPTPEPGEPCHYEAVLEGPGYNFTGPREMPSLVARELVIRSPEEWSNLIREAGIRVPEPWGIAQPPDAPIPARFARPPAVDFEKEMVLALFKGLTGVSEQHARLVIRRLRLGNDGVLRCNYAVTRRGLYTFPFAEDFSPFLMVAVPKLDAPVEFRRVR